MREHTIYGTVEVDKSQCDRCICCDGCHVVGTSIALDAYAAFSLDHAEGSVLNWIDTSLDLKTLDGRRLKITVELLPQ